MFPKPKVHPVVYTNYNIRSKQHTFQELAAPANILTLIMPYDSKNAKNYNGYNGDLLKLCRL